jgi:pyruvate formate lyase activating enzyme
MMFYKNKCTGCGKCKEKCPHALRECELCGKCALFCPSDAREICGKEYAVDEVMREILKDMPLYENTGGGVTFSGGECMLQIDFLLELLKECKANGIHTAVDTAGHLPYSYFERIFPYVDLFLYDIKCVGRERHERYTGVVNDRILENLARLLSARVPLWIRIPIVPGVSDQKEELERIKAFLDANGKPDRIELLPYHRLGEHKYAALGKEPPTFGVPSADLVSSLRRIFD